MESHVSCEWYRRTRLQHTVWTLKKEEKGHLANCFGLFLNPLQKIVFSRRHLVVSILSPLRFSGSALCLFSAFCMRLNPLSAQFCFLSFSLLLLHTCELKEGRGHTSLVAWPYSLLAFIATPACYDTQTARPYVYA